MLESTGTPRQVMDLSPIWQAIISGVPALISIVGILAVSRWRIEDHSRRIECLESRTLPAATDLATVVARLDSIDSRLARLEVHDG